jgi:hypothetical protein
LCRCFVVAALVIYLLHLKSSEQRQQVIWWFLIIVVVSLFVFLPLFRYWIGHPDQFGYRAFTRLGEYRIAAARSRMADIPLEFI